MVFFPLRSQSILITGATSGIGEAIALELAQKARGNRLGLLGRNPEKLSRVAGALKTLGAIDVHTGIVDFKSPGGLAGPTARLVQAMGGVSCVVLSAGTSDFANSERPDFGCFEEMLAVNVRSSVAILSVCIPELLKNKRAAIAGVSALAALRGLPKGADYCASKAALNAYLGSLRVDLRPRGVTVTTLMPAYVDTPMFRQYDHAAPVVWTAERAARFMIRKIEAGAREVGFPTALAGFMQTLLFLPLAWSDAIVARLGQESKKRAP